MDTNDLIFELTNISESPLPEYGGFHPRVVATAKAALAEITTLRSDRLLLAKLASETPQFRNPFHSAEAIKLRDSILSNAEVSDK